MSNARHSAATNRWGTPAEYVAMARVALGGWIELDPMSESRRAFTSRCSPRGGGRAGSGPVVNPTALRRVWERTADPECSGVEEHTQKSSGMTNLSSPLAYTSSRKSEHAAESRRCRSAGHRI